MRPSQWASAYAAIVALVTTLALGVAPAAFGADPAAPSQPSAIERLVRQEDAQKAELDRYDAVARQNDLTAALDARERSMVDPAIRTAIVARGAAATKDPIAVPARSGGQGFAWAAAALGLGVGVAGMCVLLGCVTLVRHHGPLRSA